MERLQKFLAEAGIASRRKAEELISEGKVSVNGKIIKELGFKVNEKDVIFYNGKRVIKETKNIYILFNKPEGCVTTVKDQFGRKTVLDYIPNVNERIYPIGRLDYETSGLIILTNDGDLTYTLTHPKHNVEKTYIAKVEGQLTEEKIEMLRNGVLIDDRKTYPAKVKIISENKAYSVLEIKISEGRNRQVRKMCDAVGHSVVTLMRKSIGKIELEKLKKGEYRFLTTEEIEYLKKL